MTLPSQLGREDWEPSHWAWVNGLDETRLPQKQRLLALNRPGFRGGFLV
ncbi:hypothetical protein C8R21_12250 [Nitrosospira multiformis]|uniref:Uncharacterized protein n=1 Tax=Nitrosospira multiformis TaxID=1231 RepID=A0A2T5I7P1_9PROT|nr:hypothetical protein [Nitrosospira multiformis]PTQ79845.1 hypothetical protein C8R21_12250 [Nitrosospira multiformis]